MAPIADPHDESIYTHDLAIFFNRTKAELEAQDAPRPLEKRSQHLYFKGRHVSIQIFPKSVILALNCSSWLWLGQIHLTLAQFEFKLKRTAHSIFKMTNEHFKAKVGGFLKAEVELNSSKPKPDFGSVRIQA